MGCRPIGERQSLSIRPSRERILAPPRPSPRRSRRTLATALLAIAVCGAFGWRYFHGADVGTGGLDTAVGARAPALIPVTVAQVKKADFPVYLNGLGAVEPYQTVLIRSRVDGAIVKIAFKQGQMVKQGDVLVQDRSAPLSGGARSGGGEESAGRGDPQETRSSTCSATPSSPRRIPSRFSSSTPSRRRSIN